MLLAYVPQEIYLLPWLGLIAAALIARQAQRAILPVLGASVVVIGLMGFQLHFGEPSKNVLRVMTFNIQTGNQGIDKVVALIRHENPDVFCLQECDSTPERPVIDEVSKGMNGYQIHAFGGMLIGSRLAVLSSRAVPFPPGPSHRPLLEVVVDWNGRPIRIANVHLVPVYIDHLLMENPRALPDHLRLVGRQHELQIDFLVSYSKKRTEPLILCGDFNSPANGVLYQKLAGAMQDSFATAGTGFGFTIPAALPLVRMDFIYASDELQPKACWVPSQIASDHRPTVADFVLSGF